MPIRIEVDTRRLQQIIRKQPEMIEKIMDGMAEEVVSDIFMGIQTSPPTGRAYQRRGVTHIASEPGQPPRPDIGNLLAGIRWKPDGKFKRRIEDGTEYGAHLEIGTEKIRPRPFFTPVFEMWAVRKFRDFLKKGLKI